MCVDSGYALLKSQAAVRRACEKESTTQRNTYAHVELPYKALHIVRLIEISKYLFGKPVLIQDWNEGELTLEASRWKHR